MKLPKAPPGLHLHRCSIPEVRRADSAKSADLAGEPPECNAVWTGPYSGWPPRRRGSSSAFHLSFFLSVPMTAWTSALEEVRIRNGCVVEVQLGGAALPRKIWRNLAVAVRQWWRMDAATHDVNRHHNQHIESLLSPSSGAEAVGSNTAAVPNSPAAVPDSGHVAESGGLVQQSSDQQAAAQDVALRLDVDTVMAEAPETGAAACSCCGNLRA